MKFVRLIFILSLAVVVTGALACEEGQREHFDRDAASRQFFIRNCAICHGENAEGRQLDAEKFAPNLRHGRIVAYSDERIANQIANGGGGMPSFRLMLNEKQIKEMVRYIRDMQKQ